MTRQQCVISGLYEHFSVDNDSYTRQTCAGQGIAIHGAPCMFLHVCILVAGGDGETNYIGAALKHTNPKQQNCSSYCEFNYWLLGVEKKTHVAPRCRQLACIRLKLPSRPSRLRSLKNLNSVFNHRIRSHAVSHQPCPSSPLL